ncbi:MAG: LacI family DNA-binding transcriptional regulator, partial [Oscillospiraceae bacterium]|nr:LacI family DNA-binding transcriptional regulator [Oscillospiraceae bacterium]
MRRSKTTMKDIAKDLGVSINAVSLALNDMKGVSQALRLNVIQTADRLGYFKDKPRYDTTYRNYNFCLLIQDIYVNETGFYGKVLYAVAEESKRCGYDTLLNYFNDLDMHVPSCIQDKRVSGIIIIGKISDENVALLRTFGIHIVIIDHTPMIGDINCVITDNKTGGFLATRHLLRAGFKKIGFFGDLSYSHSIKNRYYGYMEALVQYGIIDD